MTERTSAPPLVTLSRADRERYSIARALDSLVNRKRRGLEYEISEQLRSRAYGASENSILVPMAAFAARAGTPIAATVGTSGGSALVGTDLETAGFINALRPVSRVLQLGATTISDLKRNFDIPRAAAGAAASWVIEGQPMPESEGTFDKVTLKPHLASGYIQLTRDMLALLTPEAEMMIRRDVAKGIGTAIDAAAIAGTGVAPQPTGILSQAGIGSVALGANGGPVTVAAMDDLEAAVTEANVDGSTFGYLTTPAQVRKLRGLVHTAAARSGRPIPIPMRSRRLVTGMAASSPGRTTCLGT